MRPWPSTPIPRAATLLAALLLLVSCGSGDGEEEPPIVPGPLPTDNVLRLADAEGAAGSSAILVVSLKNTEALAGFQFDLMFDPAVLSVTGAAPDSERGSGLETYWNSEDGLARIIITDVERSVTLAAADGPVATLTVEVNAGAQAGATVLVLGNATGVSLDLTTRGLGGSTATFTVR